MMIYTKSKAVNSVGLLKSYCLPCLLYGTEDVNLVSQKNPPLLRLSDIFSFFPQTVENF